MQNLQNKESSEASQTTGSSTHGSTTSSTGGSTEELLLKINGASSEKGWKFPEVQKFMNKNFLNKTIKFCNWVRTPKEVTERQAREAAEFLLREFPNRNANAIYQKAFLIKKGKFKKVILL